MIRTLTALALMLAFTATAQAYDLHAKSQSTLTGAQDLATLVKSIGDQVGQNIPQSDQIQVWVISQARQREGGDEFLYNHRVELRKLLNGRNQPPYPTAGWYVIYTSETYGIGSEQRTRVELERVIRNFFEHLKGLDPKTEAP